MNAKQQVKFIPSSRTDFSKILKSRVDNYFTQNNISKYANAEMVSKSVILILAYLVPFFVVMVYKPSFPVSLLLWLIMGVAVSGIGMSVMHDANHGSYSQNKNINAMMATTLNLLGGSIFNWKLQHNILHHTYTNITHIDEDIQDRLVLKFSPHTKTRWYHQFQWIYALMFYGLLTLYWAVGKDFVQFYQFTKTGVNPNNKRQNQITFAKILGIKFFYFMFMLGLPILVFHLPVGEVIIGFLSMHFVAGVILTLVFQLAHTLEQTSHPMPLNGVIENDWAIHQLNTTVNFSRSNKVLSWYLGGLNYQVEHHLFPKISHVHYPAISHIVKQTAEEYNVPYLENKTFFGAVKSHFKYLQHIGKLPDLNEAIG